eukprot:3645400-Alexandrium_andersonii.AAC.1
MLSAACSTVSPRRRPLHSTGCAKMARESRPFRTARLSASAPLDREQSATATFGTSCLPPTTL